ncbi:polyketide synthetase, partial [Lentinula edodes]|uniref:polyketide synthetase n=1 Tax=Lentinula edodes TaxID=5353 RepID=UPI001E8CE452
PMSSPNLLSILYHHACHAPSSDFLIEDLNLSLTYREAYTLISILVPERIQQLTAADKSVGLRVALLTRNNVMLPLVTLALWYTGSASIPLSTAAEPFMWAGMINLTKPDLILVEHNLMPSLQNTLAEHSSYMIWQPLVLDIAAILPSNLYMHYRTQLLPLIDICHQWLKESGISHSTLISPDPTNKYTALTLFTSSAVTWEGLKCVSYTQEMLFLSSCQTVLMLGGSKYSGKPKRHLGWLPLSHCFEFCITFCGIIIPSGGSYIFFNPSLISSKTTPALARSLLDGLKHHSPVTSFTTMPAILLDMTSICTVDDIGVLQALASLGVGGAATSESVFQWAISNNISLFDCSGATEAVGTICIRFTNVIEQRDNGMELIQGLSGTLKKSAETDDFGELVISGPYLPSGYDYKENIGFQYEPTSLVTLYYTGDLYFHKTERKLSNHQTNKELVSALGPLSGLRYLGRVDDVIVLSSGIKVEALEREKEFDTVPGVQKSALLADQGGNVLIVLVQLTGGISTWPAVHRKLLALNVQYPYGKRVAQDKFYPVANLPLTAKYTLNRKRLKHLFKDVSEGETNIQLIFPPPKAPPKLSAFSSSMLRSHVPHSEKDRIKSQQHYGTVITILSQILSVPKDVIEDPASDFMNLPFSSTIAIQISKALMDEFHVHILPSRLYEVTNVEALCNLLESEDPYVPQQSDLIMGQSSDHAPIVISGASCCFPGEINSLDSFWDALMNPRAFRNSCSQIRPSSRWPHNHPRESKMYPSGWLGGAWTDNVLSFAQFFSIPPTEAYLMSPNARIALQLGYQAIEDAGIPPKSLSGKSWGVFTSVNESGWPEKNLQEIEDGTEFPTVLHGSAAHAVGARLSYFLNLTGPAIGIQSACSSSAIALHQARLAIENGDCEAAIVIATTTHYHPTSALMRSSLGVVSPRGICEPFMSSADGFVASEGAAAIVIQRQKSARALPYAALVTSVVSQDGKSRGFFAPNPVAQKRLLNSALTAANCSINDIQLLEAHGTGTVLGDAIELEAINDVLGSTRNGVLYIGSSKAVIGHTEECAGLAGILKCLLCLQNNIIPPQPISGPLNAVIEQFPDSIIIPSRAVPLPPTKWPRFCSVSSFGLSGTLANVIISDCSYAPKAHSLPIRNLPIFAVTACNPRDFHALCESYIKFFEKTPVSSSLVAPFCQVTLTGRDHHAIRAAWHVQNHTQILSNLRQARLNPPPSPISLKPRIGIWFGAPSSSLQYKDNYHPEIKLHLDKLMQYNWLPCYNEIRSQLAFAMCLQSIGCHISVSGGEGMGEYLAAMLSGLLPFQSAFQLLGEPHDTKWVVVETDLSVLNQHISAWKYSDLSIAGHLSPRTFLVHGIFQAVDALVNDPAVVYSSNIPPLTVLNTTTALQDSEFGLISGHFGSLLDDDLKTDYHYWKDVQHRSIDTAMALNSMSDHCDFIVHFTGKPSVEEQGSVLCVSDTRDLAPVLPHLFTKGFQIDWSVFSDSQAHLHLPLYTWAEDEA